MSLSFTESLKLQRIEAHTTTLNRKGFFITDKTDEKRKLHDLYDWLENIWIECKSDYSGFTSRLLIEAKANVPVALLDDLPLREPIPFSKLSARLEALDAKYDSLSTDLKNIEPKHLLSYLWAKTGEQVIVDLHKLRALIAEKRYDWIIFDSHERGRRWLTVAQIVPRSDLVAVAA